MQLIGGVERRVNQGPDAKYLPNMEACSVGTGGVGSLSCRLWSLTLKIDVEDKFDVIQFFPK